MADRDGVIKALEEAITFVDGRGYGGVAATMHDALELLKEQEPVKIVKQIEEHEWNVCGNCGNHMIHKWAYCPKCGRLVKWDE